MRTALIALAGLWALGCADHTRVRVVVESDLAIPSALDEVVVEVGGRSATARLEAASSLPATLELRASGDALGPFGVRVVGKHAGVEVITATRSIAFQPGATTTVTVRLEAACVGVPCEAGQRCEGGACVPDGTVDGGGPDAGGPDAGGLDASGLDASGSDASRPDACFPEICNATDDDCDSAIDEAGCEPCARTEHAGHVYLACDILHAWEAARGYCTARRYDLAVIGDLAENDHVAGVLASEPYVGLRRVAGDAFAWVDGTPVGFDRWQGAEPLPGRDCVVMRANGAWRTEDCAVASPFVCETVP